MPPFGHFSLIRFAKLGGIGMDAIADPAERAVA
jgi:hypothetical protein